MAKFNLILGVLFGLLAVVAGAAGDHIVKKVLDDEFKARGEAASELEGRTGGHQDAETDEESPADDEEQPPTEEHAVEAESNEDAPAEENAEEDHPSNVVAPNVTLTPENSSPAIPNYSAEREERLDTFETATRYQMYHSLAMVALGVMLLSSSRGAMAGLLAGLLFTLGQVLFCGCLYLISIYNIQEVTWLVPFGGTSFIAGWALFLLAAIQVQPLDADE